MNSLFSKAFQPLLSKTSYRLSLPSNEGNKFDRTLAPSSILKKVQINYLSSMLSVKSAKHSTLQEQLHFSERRFNFTSSKKTLIAQQLLQEEREWRQATELAKKKKVEATAAYLLEYSFFKSLEQEIRMKASSLKNSSEIDDVLNPIEQQRIKLKNAERILLNITEELKLLEEKGERISDLTKKFQGLKEEQVEASRNFHSIKSDWTYLSDEVTKINRLIHSMTSPATKFWTHIGDVFALTIRQRG